MEIAGCGAVRVESSGHEFPKADRGKEILKKESKKERGTRAIVFQSFANQMPNWNRDQKILEIAIVNFRAW